MSVEDKKKLWAMATFYGGSFELNLTQRCTHLVIGKPEGVSSASSNDNSLVIN